MAVISWFSHSSLDDKDINSNPKQGLKFSQYFYSFNEQWYFKTSKSSFCHHSTRQLNHKYFLSKPTRNFLTPEVFKLNSKGGSKRLN